MTEFSIPLAAMMLVDLMSLVFSEWMVAAWSEVPRAD